MDALKALQKRMMRRVLGWAGDVRTTERNIGVAAHMIGVELHGLVEDGKLWVANATFAPDEIAVRCQRRLVAIHPFPKGNGRHARLAADLLIVQMGDEFTWGSANLAAPADARKAYGDGARGAGRP